MKKNNIVKGFKNIEIIIIAIVVLGGGMYFYFLGIGNAIEKLPINDEQVVDSENSDDEVEIEGGEEEPVMIACTLEAKQCPDGSFVGRTGPNCEFEACPEIEEVLEEKLFQNNDTSSFDWDSYGKTIEYANYFDIEEIEFTNSEITMIKLSDGDGLIVSIYNKYHLPRMLKIIDEDVFSHPTLEIEKTEYKSDSFHYISYVNSGKNIYISFDLSNTSGWNVKTADLVSTSLFKGIKNN